jgi:hypothetical protein
MFSQISTDICNITRNKNHCTCWPRLSHADRPKVRKQQVQLSNIAFRKYQTFFLSRILRLTLNRDVFAYFLYLLAIILESYQFKNQIQKYLII